MSLVLLMACTRVDPSPPAIATFLPTSLASHTPVPRPPTASPPPTQTPAPTAIPTLAPSATVTTTVSPSPLPAPSVTATPTREARLTLAAVGDIMLARSLGAALQRNPADSPFAGVLAPLRDADITVGNLECALGTGGTRAPKAYTFLGPPVGARSLAEASFDIVSLANNHALDYGAAGLDQTMRLLDEQGIGHVGAGRDEAEAHRPRVVEVNGLRLAFLAYVNVPVEGSGFVTERWEARGNTPGMGWARPERVAADVGAARVQANLVIVLLHSGFEGQAAPNAIQRANAYAAIDNGAVLVLGHHAHVLQGVEMYKGGLIAYGLGNFVFDGFDGVSNETAILRVTLTRAGIESYEWAPAIIRQGRPILVEGQQADSILGRLARLSYDLHPR